MYAFLIIMAPELVLLMFGEKWMMAVPIVQILSIYGALRSTSNPLGSLLLAKGKANWGFWWNFMLLFYTPFLIYVSSFYGLEGVSWGLVILISSLLIPIWYLLVKNLCNASFIEYFKEVLVPLIISIISGIFIFILTTTIQSALIKILLVTSLGLIFLIGLNYIFNRKFIVELKGLY